MENLIPEKFRDRIISSVKLDDASDTLKIKFEGGGEIYLSDHGQSCCEHRYMSCDDDLYGFKGAELRSATVEKADDIESKEDEWGEGDVHEVEFLRILTSKGVIVCQNHNEHNGYYGGFSVYVKEVKAP